MGPEQGIDPALQAQLLQQLRDIHEPVAIGWWPFAIGWWILLALTLAAILCASIWQYLRWKQNAYRRQAIIEAEQCYRQFELDTHTSSYLETSSTLLRRVMLKLDASTADFSGAQWVNHMNRFSSEPFSEQTADALTNQIYRANPEVDIRALQSEILNWLRNHGSQTND